MKPFALFRPEADRDAQAKAGAETAFKAGGIDLLDRLKERVLAPQTVIDLMPLRANMAAIGRDADRVRLGALATLDQVARTDALRDPACTALAEAAGDAATPQIRNRATVGGNLLQLSRCWYLRNARFSCLHSGRGDTCLAQEGEHRYHAIMGTNDCIRVHPSNLAPPLYVLDAKVTVLGADGATRDLPIRDLYPEDPAAESPEHRLAADEILVAVHFAVPATGTRSCYRESREKQAHDWATTAAAVRLRLDGGKIAEAAICLGAVAPVPMARPEAAALLIGEAPSATLFAAAAERAFAEADPLDQNAYKVPVGTAVLIDALTEAARAR
ncbi:MAG: FAD binding domain-containing protein [Planctomycetota bacterium]